ncbi:isochorismatase [Rhizobium rhizosphaerae]|uniref:Isochorismatase n=1 Tax=Xaviernesmea rhizosphaerae TaxID=1672749 RepID=A0ABX3PHI5_9HYPH|nr:isochorismatase family protein [Xaviernesmea rhizosphaerae]OQP87498.1 isochorismatase [Xaviernesmea rhizosphaerae]
MARALIVIDIQNSYFPGGELPLWQAEATEAAIVAAIAKARAAGDRVILVRHEAPAGAGLFAAGSLGAALRPAILEAAGAAPQVVKHEADAFQHTDLNTQLAGIDSLILCGMMTQNCVVFTALSRAADAYDITVAGDLCTAPSEIVHQIALRALGAKRAVRPSAELW